MRSLTFLLHCPDSLRVSALPLSRGDQRPPSPEMSSARKRSNLAIVSSDSESQSDSDLSRNKSIPEGEIPAKRSRRATSKAAAAAEDGKAKKQLADYRKLKAQVKALKKQLDKQKSVDSDDPDDAQSNPEGLPPESEEENEVALGLSASVSAETQFNVSPALLKCSLLQWRSAGSPL
uniref:Uncharacterized protein n=1 Tax=Ganoderma boninense TaxID=34458 RepID=A0A5K1K436_9APHY|nr:Uncharacterized protein [Ganoderma boninense]